MARTGYASVRIKMMSVLATRSRKTDMPYDFISVNGGIQNRKPSSPLLQNNNVSLELAFRECGRAAALRTRASGTPCLRPLAESLAGLRMRLSTEEEIGREKRGLLHQGFTVASRPENIRQDVEVTALIPPHRRDRVREDHDCLPMWCPLF
ncbi:hypothetical protein SCHPADRAFT_317610 [Schizopora paradoxa]|uniref:Uncharacterized protein n=1 Tax=Schizopora paradoxa TaxID=27342 RepID=A0A0H2SC16_9AGAM|nr:hypothetical protein SCHPADRAFT_317610 [Schizopora paradoxa]